MSTDLYQILGVHANASSAEIKAAYRELVKKHHPDAGGDEQRILALNAAWEVLGDVKQRQEYDDRQSKEFHFHKEAQNRGIRNARASDAAKAAHFQTVAEEDALIKWLHEVYLPIDRLLGQIINPFPNEFKKLSADPYDDYLMKNFCTYLENSQKRSKKIDKLYRASMTPNIAKDFGLSLYHCLSQVDDALQELERYTMGYVDNYLHDGREMLREAKRRRIRLQEERRKLKVK